MVLRRLSFAYVHGFYGKKILSVRKYQADL
jgi:hypothetical protein